MQLFLSLMLKWFKKDSEVLCEAVIRLNYKGFGAALLLPLCSVPFASSFDDMKWDQVGAEMDRHKDMQTETASWCKAEKRKVSLWRGLAWLM